MNESERYIETVTVDEIPWHRLTTPYGRATQFPRYFTALETMDDAAAVEDALYELTMNTEHQGTLWHATPFAMIFLVRIFRRACTAQPANEIAQVIVRRLLEHFLLMDECVHMGDEMEHAEPLPRFSDLLREEYLWSEIYDEEADELRYEDDEVFPADLFYSFYYYSAQVLASCGDACAKKML